jgi:hypothetical protein
MNDTNQNDELAPALRRLKEDDQAMSASPSVEARLLQEVRSLQPRRRWSPQLIAGLTAAAIVVATLSITWWVKSKPVPELVTQEITTEFFPLFYSSVPSVETHLVRMELPRESLARFGLMSADGITSGTVLADVLVGDDGLARAVRFVRKLSQEQRQ